MALRAVTLLVLGGLSLAAPAARAVDHCVAFYAPIDAAIAAGDPSALQTQAQALAATPDCDTDRQTDYRRRSARALARLAKAQGLSGQPLLDALRSARKVAPVWEVMAPLADQLLDAGDAQSAARSYNQAINDILDRRTFDPPPPDASAQKQIFARANEYGMLTQVIPETMRGGGTGGVDAVILDGGSRLVTVPRLLPVRYEYAKAVMTTEGREFAAAWLESFQGSPPAALVLVGHTDPCGDRELNEVLARRRAQALADFIHDAGFKGSLTVAGFGQRCPIAFTRPYTADQQNQILRRVEVLRGTSLPPEYHCNGAPEGRAPSRSACP